MTAGDDLSDHGITRTEALRLRGYDQTTIAGNGNGHTPEPGPEIANGLSDSVRTCRGCHTPLDGATGRQWCSEACRQAARRRTAQTATTTPTATPKTTKPARATNGAPVNLNGSAGDTTPMGVNARPDAPDVTNGPGTDEGLSRLDGFRPVAWLLEDSGQLLPILTRSANGRTTA